MSRNEHYANVEPENDPVWEQRSRTLLRFLRKPRTWAEMLTYIRQWRWSESRLRHVLAYAGGSVAFGQRGDMLKWWATVPVERTAAE